MKKLCFLFVALAILCFSACGSTSSSIQSSPIISSSNQSPASDNSSISSGSYTLPCGVEISFSPSVRNDVTGNWRISTTSDSTVPADYAFEYYQEMFSSDDEIHAIWNATLHTTTRLMVSSGILFIDTLEYVDGEEHDANILFSGDLLSSKMISSENGEEIEF